MIEVRMIRKSEMPAEWWDSSEWPAWWIIADDRVDPVTLKKEDQKVYIDHDELPNLLRGIARACARRLEILDGRKP